MSLRPDKVSTHGFTLLETLIALFIFSILAMMLASVLPTILHAETGTDRTSIRLRRVQLALLMLSRDIEQTVNRPILNVKGQEEAAFIGGPHAFAFTHGGSASDLSDVPQSNLQRTQYRWENNQLLRITWPFLDQSPDAKPQKRALLKASQMAEFSYLDKAGKPHHQWPLKGETNQPLPKAVQISLTFDNWGKFKQLYILPSEVITNDPLELEE